MGVLIRKIAGVLLLGGILFAWVKLSFTSHADSCDDLKNNALARITASQQCVTDAECTPLGLTCPFSCTTPINRASVEEIMGVVREYHRGCHYFCPECPKSLLPVSCIQGRCVVRDGLTDTPNPATSYP